MRKIYTLILVLIVSLSLFVPAAIAGDNAQLANEGVIIKRDVYFMGDVGIGTTSPGAKLDVNGGIKVSAVNQDFEFAGGINMIGSGDHWNLRARTNDPTPSTEVFGVYKNDGGGIAVFRNDGNVGIGTTSPSHTLHIVTSSDVKSGSAVDLQHTGTNGREWKLVSASIANTITEGYFGIKDETDESWRMVIDNSGNVGIGTTNPETKLDVEGTVQAHAFDTGDIVFRKDGKKLWRMFEDEKGLYLESLKTGEISRIFLEKDIETLRAENKAFEARLVRLEAQEARLAKLESLLNAK